MLLVTKVCFIVYLYSHSSTTTVQFIDNFFKDLESSCSCSAYTKNNYTVYVLCCYGVETKKERKLS